MKTDKDRVNESFLYIVFVYYLKFQLQCQPGLNTHKLREWRLFFIVQLGGSVKQLKYQSSDNPLKYFTSLMVNCPLYFYNAPLTVISGDNVSELLCVIVKKNERISVNDHKVS